MNIRLSAKAYHFCKTRLSACTESAKEQTIPMLPTALPTLKKHASIMNHDNASDEWYNLHRM
jgi:hypothetical protein